MNSLGYPRLDDRYLFLGDGTVEQFPSYQATAEVDGGLRQNHAIVITDEIGPLVGTKFLAGCKVLIEYRPGGEVTVERFL